MSARLFPATVADQFARDGFLIVPQLVGAAELARLHKAVAASLDPPLGPLEYEADVRYPGAPAARDAPGGNTPRRLLHAYTRGAEFRRFATAPRVVRRVRQLLGNKPIALSQNHHNCIMTKHPGFSSATLWHQDIRYWLFDRPELVNVWLALGEERPENGGLLLIPGSHRLNLERGAYDADYFLRPDLPENAKLIESAVPACLAAGDALFFHSGAIHAAGRNATDRVKLSLVFTYRAADNQPIAETRSARYADIPC